MANGEDDLQAQYNCASCTKPDEYDDMVACDSCDLWHHFSCAKVDATVKRRKWYCKTCELLRATTYVPEPSGRDPKNSEMKIPGATVENSKQPQETGTKSKTLSKHRSALPVAEKPKSDAGSKSSKKTKRTAEETSLTSSARARLTLELKILEEQQKLEEQELAAEKELKDQQLKCEQELREKELAVEAKKLAEQKAFLERKMMEENEYRMRQLAIKKHAIEEKAKLIRQASQCGSSRTTDWNSIPDSKDKVNEWLEGTKQQTEGAMQASTSADLPAGIPDQVVSQKQKANAQALYVKSLDKKLGLPPPPATNNKDCLPTRPPQNPFSSLDRPSNVRNSARNVGQSSHMPLVINNQVEESRVGPVGRKVFDDLRGGWNLHPAAGELPEGHNYNDVGVLQSSNPPRVIEEAAYDGPTNRQLAARQVMGKDLPTFSGNPEEWPIWISNFERSTSTCGFSQDENLIRLQRCLRGPALEAVRGRLLCPSSVPHIIKTLELRYGRPETLIRAMTERIRQLPHPKVSDLDSIIEFGLAVNNLVEHLKTVKMQSHLSNPSLLFDLVSKLPADYRMKWSAYKSMVVEVNLDTFGSFMNTLVELAYEVVDDFSMEKTSRQQKQKPKDRAYVQAHSEPPMNPINDGVSTERVVKKTCTACREEGHKVADCSKFKAMGVEERWRVVQHNGLCKTCLNLHGKWPCKTFKGCGFDNCHLRHHTLLHSMSTTVNTTASAVSTSHLDEVRMLEEPLFRILPVTLYGRKCQLNVFAFIDEGSQLTLLEDTVADQLGIDGAIEPLSLQWTANIKRTEPKSRRITAEISGSGSSKRFRLSDVRTVEGLLLPSQSLRYRELAEKHPHLRGLPLQDYAQVSPKLLIGLDNLKLTVSLGVREGEWNDPIAAKCRLGWSVYGCSKVPTTTYTSGFHVGGWTDPEQELNEMVRDFFALENVGIGTNRYLIESDEDRRARMLLESTTRRVPTGFETGLLWKADGLKFPDSRGMAVRRLRALEKKLSGDTPLYECVREQIRDYQAKGYAHRATDLELASTHPEETWYLPLGVHRNPRKPDKVRLIWDAAAKVQGTSFNSALLKGPDMLTSLPGVLSHFRLYQYALTGDIKEMFHRIRIRDEDRQFQRFLWRDSVNEEPQVFVMDVCTFGSTSSPCSAQYVKNLNAGEFTEEYPRAAHAIVNYHYVDDYLDSFGTAEEAERVGKRVKWIHAQGGFELRNFLSNVAGIAEHVGSESGEIEKPLALDRVEGTESVLGMKWIPSSDVFTYSFMMRSGMEDILERKRKPTKREVLRVVMSLFDPLGLISFFLVHGKILMQDIWASGADWDEAINDGLYVRWRQWSEFIPKLTSVRIPRCYFSGANPATYASLQVHVFTDASEAAYSSVVYFRVVTSSGPVVSLVAAKTKVAPLKMLSIPRLELQAAVLGSRLLNSVVSMHGLSATKRFLWTDSATVLAWIRSDQRRYHQFVGFRIGEILSSTEVNEWRWIPSKLNVADDATKWGSGPNFDPECRWFRGPDFLRQSEESWPHRDQSLVVTGEELRVCNFHQPVEPELIDTSRFSRWERMQRTTAYVHRFIENCRRKVLKEPLELGALTQNELVQAARTLWKQAQRECYPSEVKVLEKTQGDPENQHGTVSQSSMIYKLWPYMDEHGILRKRTRLSGAQWIPKSTIYPVILPRQSRITVLLVEWYHRRFRHANSETVVNEMRQLYEILKLRSVIAKVSRLCMWCRVHRAIPSSPPMAPLPIARLTPFIRPFTFVGLDYFGPVLVKVGRSNVKRWIALFTCMTVRAIHLEVVHNLSTESCVLAVRRFVARRGTPAEIFSDNGTNFQGADNQLKREIEERNICLAAVFTDADTRWTFNPPGAPHMGGAWERMVRSVKAAISTVQESQRKPDDEVLLTVMHEAEFMVNSRPLTYIPLESADEESLTPNHFILGSSNGIKPMPTEPVDSSMTLRSGWRWVQHLSHVMWRRWIKEYLPVISRRTKWFEDVKEISEGDLVLVVDGALRNQWLRGRVEKVVAGRDGRVRQAWVRTENGVLRRPVVKLALLDVAKGGKPEPEDFIGLRAGECDDEYPPAPMLLKGICVTEPCSAAADSGQGETSTN